MFFLRRNISEITEHRAHASRKKVCLFSRRVNNPQVMSGSRSWTKNEFHEWELQKFCRRNCWVCVAPRKLEHRLTLKSTWHEAAIISQVERRLPKQWLASQTCHFEHNTLSNGYCQWSSRSTCVMWCRRHVPVISRAVAFCTDCDLCSRVSGRP